MANYGGTLTVANSTGTLTAADASTATNAGASWPTAGGGMSGLYIRILTGPGASTTPVLIASNTATVITISGSWPAGTPNNTSTYEIVLILKNNDHITSTLSLGSGSICELDDSATIYIDGNYGIRPNNASAVIRWQKTESTMATFVTNNRTTQGTPGFWAYIFLNANFTTAPKISYIKIIDASGGLVVDVGYSLEDIHHIWVENSASATGYNSGTLTADSRLRNMYWKGEQFNMVFTVGGAYEQKYERCWFEGIAGHIWSNGGSAKQTIKECVFENSAAAAAIDATVSQTFSIYDSYYKTSGGSQRLVGCTTASAAGTYNLMRNNIKNPRAIYSPATSSAKCYSNFNDVAPLQTFSNAYSFTDVIASGFNTFTSDNDFISGMTGALPENIDTTSGMTTSNATPAQYKNLTANRTNAKSVRNFPLVMDNVVVSGISQNQATFTFDSQNGAVAGQGSSTVDADSSSGQTTLNVADTTGFSVGETIEVGYGTARYETIIVSSIDAGVSIVSATNLAYTHTAVQADTVKKVLRHIALPSVEYGTTSGVYTMRSDLPHSSNFGPIYCGLVTSYNGMPIAFNRVGHSITLYKLKSGQTYYYRAIGLTPQGELMISGESTFTTLNDLTSGFFI